MANGILNIWGTQYGIPPGNYKDILSIPYSDVIQVVNVIENQTDSTIAVPAGCQGCIVIPELVSGTPTLRFATTGNPTSSYVSPTYPTIVSFDPSNMPTFVYVTNTTLTVTIRFF